MSRGLSSSVGLNHLLISDGTYSKASSAFPFYLKPSGAITTCYSIKAMAGDARENLHHMQRGNGHQSHPSKRAAPVAPIGLWDRFPTARTVQQMMETMEKMMEDPFTHSNGEWDSSSAMKNGESGSYRRGRTPWEIKEGESEYKMRFGMPGMTKEDVKVWVEEKVLVVKAEKASKNGQEAEAEAEKEKEWSAKSYARYNSRIVLPENVQVDKIKAEVKDGILYINMPKAGTSSKILDIHVQ